MMRRSPEDGDEWDVEYEAMPRNEPTAGSSSSPSDETRWASFMSILAIAVPTGFANLLEYLPVSVGMFLVGRRRRSDELDAMALARSYFNLVAFSVAYGLIGALRTLCPQAAAGGRSKELQGVYAQRACLIVLFGSIPSTFLAFYADAVLVAFGQPPHLCSMAQQYCVRLLPGLYGLSAMTILQRVMTSEGLVLANFWICVAVFLCAPALQWALIARCGWLGAAWASSVYNSLYLFLQIPVMRHYGLGHVFTPRREALRAAGLRDYLSLALPALAFTVLEWWSMEFALILGGTRAAAESVVGALATCVNFASVLAMVWIGLLVAVSTTVGDHVARGHVRLAKRSALLGLATAAAAALAVSAALLVFQRPLASAYGSGPIARLVGTCMPALAVMATCDALNTTMEGALSGAGLQLSIAAANVVAWLLVGGPVALSVVFGLDLDRGAARAILFACALALATSLAIQCAIFSRLDWDRAVKAAHRRLTELDGDDMIDPRTRRRRATTTTTTTATTAPTTPPGPSGAQSTSSDGAARRSS